VKPLGEGNAMEDSQCVGVGRIWRLTGTSRFTAHTVSQRLRHNAKQVPAELWPLGEPPRMRPLSFYSAVYLRETQLSSLLSPSRLPATRSPAICGSTRPSASRGKTAPPIPTPPLPTPRSTNKERELCLDCGEGGATRPVDLDD
jgi:hypothetical protein